MRKVMCMALCIACIAACIGCNDPLYTAEHRQLIRTQTMILEALQKHCHDGDDAACRDGLDIAVDTMQILSKEN